MRTLRVLLLLTLFLLAVPRPGRAQEATNSPYQFLNLMAEPLDLYLDGEAVFFGVEPTVFARERVLTDTGAYPFAIYAENADRTTTDAFAELAVELSAGTPFLLVAYMQADGTPALMQINRDLAPIGANLGRLQAVNLSQFDALTVTGQNADVLVEALPAGEILSQDISAGNYQVTLTEAAGEQVGATGTNLQPGTLTVLIMYGDARTIQFSEALEQKALFRFVHGGRVSPALDVYMNDVLTFENIAFQGVTDYALVEAGTYPVALYEAGADPASSAPLWSGNVILSTSLPQTGVALGETNFRLLTYADDLLQLPLDTVRVRVINAALNMPLMTVTDATESVLVGGLEYALGSQNLARPVGEDTFTFRETDAAFTISLDNFALEPHTSYTFVVVGNALIEDGVTILTLPWRWDQGE